MTQLVITDLEPKVIEKLKARATRQGRTLDAELKAILTDLLSPNRVKFLRKDVNVMEIVS